ncbi:hypothetical protein [Pseudomonas sp. GM49]|uniref:hypothetical protein n=1 Tax=Pseudomonas sp. GM49 TaxID=1144331 RepID=UPI0012FAED0D|nr:hypothetical protein [Pseudomonas sp. GM49]
MLNALTRQPIPLLLKWALNTETHQMKITGEMKKPLGRLIPFYSVIRCASGGTPHKQTTPLHKNSMAVRSMPDGPG